jgi:hypothetical protein
MSQLVSTGSDSLQTPGDLLKEQLHGARREWPIGSHKFFVPRCAQESLITEAVVKLVMQAGDPSIQDDKAEKYAKKTCQRARQFFAILTCIGKGHEMRSLLRQGVSDKDLPLRREVPKFKLKRETGGRIRALDRFSQEHLENFDRIQWWMISPVFEDKEHYDLEDNTALPFISISPNAEANGEFNAEADTEAATDSDAVSDVVSDDELDTKSNAELNVDRHEEFNEESDNEAEASKITVSGFSEVYPRRLHPSHHNFWKSSGSEVWEHHFCVTFSYLILYRTTNHWWRSRNCILLTKPNSSRK